ncbi:Sec-independent protein translocase protein TatB [Sphingosinicella sp. YJ22]|uniref:Sec-independent protein translocase protein TatB n=1 Tax=Sphingosinicella sp. YJ22 TaxID=1104780 RepID=UPI00140B480D|nr:Sec-independent protein translocase protein TatB [Sphingosinicella sp. YJ22]
MFGVDSSELFLIVLVAVVVIGPKDLPRVMREIGKWVGKARGMASQFRLGVDQMMRETEIADLEKKWREQNEAIMKAHPAALIDSDWGKPALPEEAETTAVLLDKPMTLDKRAPAEPAASAIPAPVAESTSTSRPARRAPRAKPGLP